METNEFSFTLQVVIDIWEENEEFSLEMLSIMYTLVVMTGKIYSTITVIRQCFFGASEPCVNYLT